jgi:hypothetical protein
MGAPAEPEQLVQWFDTPELHDSGGVPVMRKVRQLLEARSDGN